MSKLSDVGPENLLIGVAAHVSREEMAHALVKRVGAQVLNVDKGNAGCYRTAVIACVWNHFEVLNRLAALVTDKHSWVIVLEDDALPVPNFRKHAAAALSYAPYLAGFYIGQAGAERNLALLTKSLEDGVAWAAAPHMVSAVAYAIRTDVLPEIIKRYPGFTDYEATVERRITTWSYERRGGTAYGEPQFYYTLPSLVDHSEVDSIVFPGADGTVRHAWSVGVAKNWDTRAVVYDPPPRGLTDRPERLTLK
jgi:hypothetical protein